MKNIVLATVSGAFLLALAGHGCSKGTGENVILAKFGQQLGAIEGIKEVDIVTKQISYDKVGKGQYDSISKRAAVNYALILQLDHLVKLNDAKKLPATIDIVAIMDFGSTAVPKALKMCTKLDDELKRINPKNDFFGPTKAQLPKAEALLKVAKERVGQRWAALEPPLVAKDIKLRCRPYT